MDESTDGDNQRPIPAPRKVALLQTPTACSSESLDQDGATASSEITPAFRPTPKPRQVAAKPSNNCSSELSENVEKREDSQGSSNNPQLRLSTGTYQSTLQEFDPFIRPGNSTQKPKHYLTDSLFYLENAKLRLESSKARQLESEINNLAIREEDPTQEKQLNEKEQLKVKSMCFENPIYTGVILSDDISSDNKPLGSNGIENSNEACSKERAPPNYPPPPLPVRFANGGDTEALKCPQLPPRNIQPTPLIVTHGPVLKQDSPILARGPVLKQDPPIFAPAPVLKQDPPILIHVPVLKQDPPIIAHAPVLKQNPPLVMHGSVKQDPPLVSHSPVLKQDPEEVVPELPPKKKLNKVLAQSKPVQEAATAPALDRVTRSSVSTGKASPISSLERRVTSKENEYTCNNRLRSTINQESESNIAPPLPPRQINKLSMVFPAGSGGATQNVEGAMSEEPVKKVNHLAIQRNDRITCTGVLYKTGSNRKEFLPRYCELASGRLSYFITEKPTITSSVTNKMRNYMNIKSEVPQDMIDIRDMTAVAKLTEVKNNPHDLCCFELSTVKEKGRCFLFGATCPSDRDMWIENIIQSIAPPSHTYRHKNKEVLKAGYLFVRVGLVSLWKMSWIILSSRQLTICPANEEQTDELDLRKIMKLQHHHDSHHFCGEAFEKGTVFHIDYPGQTLYFQADIQKDTEDWYKFINHEMSRVGEALQDQKLTSDNIPVIVDKCIKFVSMHGMSSEGIYRVGGTNSKVAKLLEALKTDPWSVQLRHDDRSEHEVSTVLKRFFRTLPEALLTTELHDQWVSASGLFCKEERIVLYQNILKNLPEINYKTLQYLIGHLRSVSDLSKDNLMPVLNLASIFGPTLLCSERDMTEKCLENATVTRQMDVIEDFITNYQQIFQVSEKEMATERKILKAVQELRQAKNTQKPAEDILIGIYIYSKEWGKCLNVRLSPSLTSQELCQYAIQHGKMKDKLESISVFEVVCNGELERPLHYSEIVFAVTLRWSKWSDADAKDNFLVVKKNEIYGAVMPLVRQPISMFSELKFGDNKSKGFKKYCFEFKNARLAYYKDERVSTPLGMWNVEDITWYIGAESKKQLGGNWCFTFIDRNLNVKRTKDSPYFGRTVCCGNEEEFHKWIAAMLIAEFPNGLLPKKEVLDLLS